MSLVGKRINDKRRGYGTILEIKPGKAIVSYDAEDIPDKEVPLKYIKDKKLVTIFEDPIVRKPEDFDKNSKPLNFNNLAYLGFLDDFYDLYSKLIKYNDTIFEEAEQENRCPSLTYYKKLDNSVIDEITKPFFEKYSYLFADPPYIITPKYDNEDLVNFKLYRIDNQRSSPDIKMVRLQFTSFLDKLYNVVFFTLMRDDSNQFITSNSERDFKRLNEHIFAEFEKAASVIHSNSVNIKELDKPIYIFDMLSNTVCSREKHNVSTVRVYVPKLSDLSKIDLPVHYCEDCQRYMIGRHTLSQFDKAYKKILVRRIKMDDPDSVFSEFDLESMLHQYGYNVVEGELTEDERHELLAMLLDTGKMTNFEICSRIEQNLNLFQGRPGYESAAAKWSDDLLFLETYVQR